jgi:hypothetical protein
VAVGYRDSAARIEMFELSLVFSHPELMSTDVHLTKEIRFGRGVQKASLDAYAPGHRRRSTTETHGKDEVDEATQGRLHRHNLYCELYGSFAFSSCFLRRKGFMWGVGASVCKVCTG